MTIYILFLPNATQRLITQGSPDWFRVSAKSRITVIKRNQDDSHGEPGKPFFTAYIFYVDVGNLVCLLKVPSAICVMLTDAWKEHSLYPTLYGEM